MENGFEVIVPDGTERDSDVVPEDALPAVPDKLLLNIPYQERASPYTAGGVCSMMSYRHDSKELLDCATAFLSRARVGADLEFLFCKSVRVAYVRYNIESAPRSRRDATRHHYHDLVKPQ